MRRLSSLLAIAMLLGLTVACAAPAAAPTPAKAPAAAPAPTKAPAVALAPAATPTAVPAKPTAPAAKLMLRYGTVQQASGIYPYGVAHAKVMNAQVPEISVTVVETGASVENMKRMAKGELEIGITTPDLLWRAMRGMDPFKDAPITDQRYIWVHSLLPVLWIVREDSGVKKLEDLSGKDFNPGMRGSATEDWAKKAMEANGIKPKYYIGGTDDAVAAIQDRRIVGYVKASPGLAAPDGSILQVMTFTPVRALPWTKEQLAKAQEAHPWLPVGVQPAGIYKADWNKDPIPTFVMPAGVATTTKLSEEIVYKIVKAIVEDNKPGGAGIQAAAYPSAKGLDIAKQTIEQVALNVPLHAGAYKYYQELGLKIPDAAVPPEVKR